MKRPVTDDELRSEREFQEQVDRNHAPQVRETLKYKFAKRARERLHDEKSCASNS